MKETGKLRHLTSIYLTKGNQILLLYRQGSRVVNNKWVSSAGGHFEVNELNNAYACALRELDEELQLKEDDLLSVKMRYVTLYNNAKDLRQNYYFFAELKDHVQSDFISNEGLTKWFDFDEISHLDMPFTSKMVTEHYLKEGKNNEMIYGGSGDGEKVVFTKMPEF